MEAQSRKDTLQQPPSEGSWASYGSSGASMSQQQHHNGFASDMHKVQLMPDVISDVQTMSLNRVDDFMDDERVNDPMMSHHQTSNLLNLDHLTNDPMLSASSTNNQIHQQQLSTVDMSSIDPIIANYGLMSMHHHANCDNASVESILQSDSDSLISDIDMIA